MFISCEQNTIEQTKQNAINDEKLNYFYIFC